MSYQKVIHALQNMDIQMLDTLLDESCSHSGASKETYLKKLEVLFSEMKLAGDTHLEPYSGYCFAEFCDNCGRSGVMLVGNHSRDFLSFIIENDPEKPMTIEWCYEFLPDELPETKERKEITVYTNEKRDFTRQKEFNALKQRTTKASDEVYGKPDKIFLLTELFNWREKYSDLENSLNFFLNYPPDMMRIGKLLDELGLLKEDLKFLSLYDEAIRKYEALDLKDESAFVKWLVAYEELRTKAHYLSQLRKHKQPEDLSYFIFFDVKIEVSECLSLIQFYHYHDVPYQQMVEKYHIRPGWLEWEKEKRNMKLHEIKYYQREMKIQVLVQDPLEDDYVDENEWTREEEEEYAIENSKLSYHLRKRGII